MATWATKGEPVAAAPQEKSGHGGRRHVRAEEVLVGRVERDLGRAVDDVGERALEARRSAAGAQPRLLESPSTKRNFRAAGPAGRVREG